MQSVDTLARAVSNSSTDGQSASCETPQSVIPVALVDIWIYIIQFLPEPTSERATKNASVIINA